MKINKVNIIFDDNIINRFYKPNKKFVQYNGDIVKVKGVHNV